MKTAKTTNGNFPRTGRFSIYICSVLVMSFFNWIALNAQTASKANNINSQLAIALEEETEPAIQLQDWMMDFENGYLTISEESELDVEPWMLSFNLEHMAVSGESEIPFEPWMINFEKRCLAVEEEPDFPVESWMVSTCTWECIAQLLAGK